MARPMQGATPLEMRGEGPFETPPAQGRPLLGGELGEQTVRLEFVLQGGKTLRIPMERETVREMYEYLAKLFRDETGVQE